jgi:hypothetical protein
MGVGLEVVTSFVTAPGATLTAAAACTGNSLTIRSAAMTSNVYLINSWSFNQVEGTTRIRSPRLHDNVQGIRSRVPAASVLQKWPTTIQTGFQQYLVPQDTLIVEISGSGTAGQIESNTMMIYYTSLPGISARLINNATLQQAGKNLCTIEATITAVATGQYGGAVLASAATQNLKANTDYALVGGITDTRGTVVRVSGVDFGNLGVGFPAEPATQDLTSGWFIDMAAAAGFPLIPVFNSANAGGLSIDVQTNQAAGTYIVDLYCVELAPNTVPLATSGPGS